MGAALTRLLENFDGLALAAKLSLIRSLIDQVVIKKDEVIVCLKSPEVRLQRTKKLPEAMLLEARDSGEQINDERINWGSIRPIV